MEKGRKDEKEKEEEEEEECKETEKEKVLWSAVSPTKLLMIINICDLSYTKLGFSINEYNRYCRYSEYLARVLSMNDNYQTI